MRVLIVGVGNVLRGDDGFGIEALRLLQRKVKIEGVEFFESGIAGISLVQRLMDGFDALVIVDALDRGGAPGQVYVLQPELGSLDKENANSNTVDLHQADLEGVLRLANALRVVPQRVWIVGCQAVGCDDLGAPLSESVAQAIPIVAERVQEIIENLIGLQPVMSPAEEIDPPEKKLAARDEILQVMYWLHGEELAKEVTVDDLTRWVSLDAMQIRSLLVDLAESKLLEAIQSSESDGVRFRLTDTGLKEGGRRFADEFAELTKPGHYECGDPNCECRRTGNPADCIHQL
jgi:hydrogenase maturation protease